MKNKSIAYVYVNWYITWFPEYTTKGLREVRLIFWKRNYGQNKGWEMGHDLKQWFENFWSLWNC